MPLPLLALTLAFAAPQDTVVKVGAWSIIPATTTSCQATARFGEHLAVSIEDDGTGNGHVVIADDRWLLKEGAVRHGIFSWESQWDKPVEVDFTAHKADKSGTWLLVADAGPWMTENMVGAKKFLLKIPAMDFDQSFDVPNAYDLTAAISECSNNL